jgi:O-antigen ligase
MLVPPSWRVAGVTLFDIFIYGVLFLGLLQAVVVNGLRIRRLSHVELALGTIAIISLVTYLGTVGDFSRQRLFLEERGFDTAFLFERLSVYGVMTLLLLAGVFHLVSRRFTSPGDMRRVVGVIVASGTVNAIVTLGFWFVTTGGAFDRYNYLPPLEESQGLHLDRMVLVFVLAFAVWTTSACTRRQRFGLLVAMLLCGASMATVMVRMGWVAFALTLVLLVAFSSTTLSSRRRAGAAAIFALILATAVWFVQTQATGSLALFREILEPARYSRSEGDVVMRIKLVMHGLAIFSDHTLVGVGYGHYAAYSTEPVFVAGEWKFVSSPHNGLITVAAETGVLGLGCFAWLCVALVGICRRARHLAGDKLARCFANAVLSVLTVALFTQVIANTSILPVPVERGVTQNSFVLWFLFGMAAAVVNGRTNTVEVPCGNQS